MEDYCCYSVWGNFIVCYIVDDGTMVIVACDKIGGSEAAKHRNLKLGD